MKTNTIQNKLKKMQLFFKKSLLFEKIIISLHLDKKSSGFATLSVTLRCRKFQKIKVTKRSKISREADLLICNLGKFLQPQRRIVNPRF